MAILVSFFMCSSSRRFLSEDLVVFLFCRVSFIVRGFCVWVVIVFFLSMVGRAL